MISEADTDGVLAKRLNQFRLNIIQKVIENVQFKNNIKFTKALILSDDDTYNTKDGFEGWNYDRQNQWQGACADSTAIQSPIDIITAQVVTTTSQIRLITHYQGDQDTIAVRGPNDYFLIGDFGFAVYQNGIES